MFPLLAPSSVPLSFVQIADDPKQNCEYHLPVRVLPEQEETFNMMSKTSTIKYRSTMTNKLVRLPEIDVSSNLSTTNAIFDEDRS